MRELRQIFFIVSAQLLFLGRQGIPLAVFILVLLIYSVRVCLGIYRAFSFPFQTFCRCSFINEHSGLTMDKLNGHS